MNKKMIRIAGWALCLALAVVGVGAAAGSSFLANPIPVQAVNGDTHSIDSFTGKGEGTVVNNGATPNDIAIADPGYAIKQVIIGWKHNKSNDGVTANVSVGGVSLGSGTVGGQNTTTTTTIGDGNTSLSGAVSITWTNGMSGTGKGTLYIQTLTLVEGQAATTYTVSFDGNGASSGSMANVTEVSGSYTLPASGYTAPSGKAFAGWKANNSGDLIAAGGTYNVNADVTFYAQWADAYTVTYSAGSNGTGSFADANKPAGTYTLLPFVDLTGVSASDGYRFKNYTVGGVEKNPGDTITLNAATAVTVNFEVAPLEGVYDFTENWSTYAAEWGGYAPHVVSGTDLGADYEASISFTNVSKQATTITDRPVIAAKSGTASTMLFTLDSSVSSTLRITTVDVSFTRWSDSKKVGAALYKGSSASGTVLDSFSEDDAPKTLSISNLNGDTFIVDFTTSQSGNQQLGIASITIGLEAKAAYGTTNHIKVTSFPNTIYHVGETYDGTGLAVTAYDGANENTANYKDVTAEVVTSLTSGAYVFADGDVPSKQMSVTFTENGTPFNADPIVMNVYALAEYELVTETPADWSGQYLLVASYTDAGSNEHTVAINSALTNFDQPLNFKEVTVSNGTITSGQELEWTIAAYNEGYSMQGKNGKFAYGNSSNRFMTSASAQELSFSLSANIATITGASGYILRLNTATAGSERFGFYSGNGVTSNISLYKLVESDDVSDFADMFLETLSTGASAVCKYNPSTQAVTTDLGDLKQAWKDLADLYDLLSPADKEQFRLGVASTDPGASNVAKTLALYDFVAAKYNTQLQGTGFVSNYDFMQRGILPMSGHLPVMMDSNTTMPLIIAVAALGTAAAAGFFLFQRKRKEF